MNRLPAAASRQSAAVSHLKECRRSAETPLRQGPRSRWSAAALLLLAVVAVALPARAALDAGAARRLLETRQNSVVAVRGVLKVQPIVNGNPAGPEREVPVKATGTIVDSSGLVAACSFELNPIGAMVKKPIRTEVRGQAVEYEMKTRLENLRFGLPDRSEWPARILVEDEDLTVVLLVPEPKPGEKLPAFEPVRFDEAAVPAPFTQYLVLDRGSESFRDAPMLDAGMVGAVLAKPRAFYVQDLSRSHVFLGSPFYDLAGRLLGTGSMSLRLPEDPTSGQMDSWPVPVILPAADLRDFVHRALKRSDTAKPPSPPPASTDRLDLLPADKAMDVVRRWSDAVVVVEGSVKYNCGRCAEEHQVQVNRLGVVLDAAGLVVMHRQGKAQGHKYLEQNLRFILSDQSEVAARILLEDDDFLLTVLAPVAGLEKTNAFKPLPLAADVQADLFDHVLVLSRLGKDHRYLPAVSAARIMARVVQPRPFYLANVSTAGPFDLGQPVLMPDGRLLGIVATEPDEDDKPGGAALPGLGGGVSHGTDSRIVPATALADLLRQARAVLTKTPVADAPR